MPYPGLQFGQKLWGFSVFLQKKWHSFNQFIRHSTDWQFIRNIYSSTVYIQLIILDDILCIIVFLLISIYTYSIYLSVYLSIRPSIYAFIHPFIQHHNSSNLPSICVVLTFFRKHMTANLFTLCAAKHSQSHSHLILLKPTSCLHTPNMDTLNKYALHVSFLLFVVCVHYIMEQPYKIQKTEMKQSTEKRESFMSPVMHSSDTFPLTCTLILLTCCKLILYSIVY